MKSFMGAVCIAVAAMFACPSTADAGLFSWLFNRGGCSGTACQKQSSQYVRQGGKLYRKQCTPQGCKLVEVK